MVLIYVSHMAQYLSQLSRLHLASCGLSSTARMGFLLPRILLFSSPRLYFLSGWPTYTSCLARRLFIKIHDWQNTDNSPALNLSVCFQHNSSSGFILSPRGELRGSTSHVSQDATLTVLLPFKTELLCCLRVSLDVKRHHDHSNSYKGKL